MPGDIAPVLYALFWSGVIGLACWFVAQWLEVVRAFRGGQETTAESRSEAGAPLGDRRPL